MRGEREEMRKWSGRGTLQFVCVCVRAKGFGRGLIKSITGELFLIRKFTSDAVVELERFYSQKIADFKSILINYVQLQMHINKKVKVRDNDTLYSILR